MNDLVFYTHRRPKSSLTLSDLSAEFSMVDHETLVYHMSWMAGVQVTVLVWALPEAMHPTDSDDHLHAYSS